MLTKAISDAGNDDDLFYPAVTVFSHGRARWIYEHYSKNGEKFFLRKACDGLHSYPKTVYEESSTNSPVAGWASLFDVDYDRTIELIYHVTVEKK